MPPDQLPHFSPGLTRHTVLLCLSRKDHAIHLKSILERAGFEVEVALSQYEALGLIEVLMPHVLVTDSVFKDGDVARLRQSMQENTLVSEIPCIALVANKSERSLMPLKGYSWHSILIGPPNPSMIVKNIRACLSNLKGASPFIRPLADFEINQQTQIRFPAEAIGRIGERIIFRSMTRIDRETVLKCEPVDGKSGEVELHQGVNLRGKKWFFNIFPFSQQRGPGRSWMTSLPQLSMDWGAVGVASKVLWQEENQAIQNDMQSMMAPYGIELVPSVSIDAALDALGAEPERFSAVVLKETDEQTREQRVPNLKRLLNLPVRPTVVILSSFAGTQVDPSIRFVPYPTGFGRLLDAVEAALERPKAFLDLEKDNNANAVKCNLILSVDVVAIDEIGGVIFSPYPLEPGSQMLVENEPLMDLLGGQTEVIVTTCLRDVKYWDRWQIHFARMSAGTSRLKYWQRILDKAA